MKRLTVVCISFIVISLMFTGISYAKIDPETCVGMWSFDESAGDVANDSSGNDNDGQLFGNPGRVDGQFGKCLEFDGVDDYVEVPDITTPSIITFGCWFKRLGSGNGGVPRIHSSGGSPTWSLEFGIGNSHAPLTDKLGFYLAFTDGSAAGWTAVFDVENDVWYHTAISWDGDWVHVYVDGTEVYSEEIGGGKNINPGISRIGGHASGGDCFEGLIDEVAIYDVVLTGDDIKRIMTPTAVSPSGKLATTWANLKK